MDLLFIVKPQLSAGIHRSTTTLNHSEVHNLQKISKEKTIYKKTIPRQV